MALIKCPECEHEVSDTAITCPNCGYTLKKEITQQKRASFFSKFKIPIIVILIIGAIAGYVAYDQSTIPKNKIGEFMSNYIFDRDKWRLAFGEEDHSSSNVWWWDNCELVEGVQGQLTIVKFDGNETRDWEWEVIGDDNTMKAIQRSLSKSLGTLETKSLDGYDEAYQYKWVEYAPDNYSTEWTLGDDKVTAEKVEGWHHSVVLLKKGNSIGVQYIPTNRYEGFNMSYYDLD